MKITVCYLKSLRCEMVNRLSENVGGHNKTDSSLS